MRPYQFSNVPRNYITQLVFKNHILYADIEDTCDFLWSCKKDIEDFAPDFFKPTTKEEFIEKWQDRIEDAKNFMRSAGFIDYKYYDLYRAVILGPEDVKPNLKEPGSCWTDSKEYAELFGKLILDTDDDPNFAICILTAEIDIEEIDLLGTLILNAIEPSEREIRVYNDASFESLDYEVL